MNPHPVGAAAVELQPLILKRAGRANVSAAISLAQ